MQSRRTDSRAYRIKRFLCSPEQRRFINGLLKGLDERVQLAFKHLFASTLIGKDGDEFPAVPMSEAFLRSHFGIQTRHMLRLEQRGLLEASGYNRWEGKSREWSVNRPSIIEPYNDLEVTASFLGDRLVNLMDDRYDDRPRLKGGRLYGTLPNEAIRVLEKNRTVVRVGDEVSDYIENLTFESCRVFDEKRLEKIARLRGARAALAYMGTQRQARGRNHEGELFSYLPLYSPRSTGRIFEEYGGVQGCPKDLRRLLLDLPEEYELRNYDISSSQLVCLLQLFDLANSIDPSLDLDTTWIQEYISASGAKVRYAEQTGLIYSGMTAEEREGGISVWKECLYGIVYGSAVKRGTAVWKAVEDEYGPDRTAEIFPRIKQALKPLEKELVRWRHWLASYLYADEREVKSARNGRRLLCSEFGLVDGKPGVFVQNACKVRAGFSFQRERNLPVRISSSDTRKIAAHIIQGMESAAIHWLTVLPESFPELDYRVAANIHDGVVTLGEVPTAAWEEALRRSGLEGAVLEEKPL